MSDYKKIRKAIKIKCLFSEREAIKAFNKVNKGIKKILKKDKKGATKEIKALICHLEGRLNHGSYYSIMAVAYALIICAISILSNMINFFMDSEDYDIILLDLNMYTNILNFLFFSISTCFCEFIELCKGLQKKFFLKVLYLKLDELNNKCENSIEPSTTNETDTTNKNDTANE